MRGNCILLEIILECSQFVVTSAGPAALVCFSFSVIKKLFSALDIKTLVCRVAVVVTEISF